MSTYVSTQMHQIAATWLVFLDIRIDMMQMLFVLNCHKVEQANLKNININIKRHHSSTFFAASSLLGHSRSLS